MLLLESAHDYNGNRSIHTRQTFADFVAYQESTTMKMDKQLHKTAHIMVHRMATLMERKAKK
jgi:hypothetical protein